MQKKILFLSLLLFVAFTSNSGSSNQNLSNPKFSKESFSKKVGFLTVKINGFDYSAELFSETKPYSYEVTAGNKNYEIKLAWRYISTPGEIKTGSFYLSEGAADVMLGYINFNSYVNYLTRSGYLTVNENDGSRVTGEFGFVASGMGSASKHADEMRFTDGKFEIIYRK